MDRRSFLARSAIGSGVLAAGAPLLAVSSQGCGAAVVRPELGATEARRLIAQLDRGLSAIRELPEGTFARSFASHSHPDLSERVVRGTLEGFVVADVARAIPENVNLPRALTDRLAPELPLLHRSIETHHALLTAMPRRARRNITERMRERPDAPMEIAGWIDGHAAQAGVSASGRVKLRQVAARLTSRMRRQSASAVIDDYVGKVERAVARTGGSLEQARSAATTALTYAIWQQVGDGAPLSGGLGEPRRTAPTVIVEHEAPPVPQEELRWSREWARPGDPEIRTAAIMMPLGLLTCGVTLIIGLLVLIVGVVQNEEWDGSVRAEERDPVTGGLRRGPY